MSIYLDSVSLVVPSIRMEDKVLKNFSLNGVKAKEKELLTNINLNLKNGVSYGLLGSNGAGKTTLLKVLMGLYAPTKGKITIEDCSWNSYYAGGLSPRIKCV
jgi:ABC-type multidrug transport system ATPase subunit